MINISHKNSCLEIGTLNVTSKYVIYGDNAVFMVFSKISSNFEKVQATLGKVFDYVYLKEI